MVLPFLQVLDTLDLTSQALPEKTLFIIGQVLVQCATDNKDRIISQLSALSPKLDVIVECINFSTDQLVQILDAGAAKIVVPASQLPELNDLPGDRILARVSKQDLASLAGVSQIAPHSAGIIFDARHVSGADIWLLNSKSARPLPTRGPRLIYMQYSEPPPGIAQLQTFPPSIHPAISVSYLTSSSEGDSSRLSISQISLLGAKTDRSDGLYSTLVVDEQNHALGLVYSSHESIAETVRTGTGVYHSRKRGLWYKGATSGATQEILRISWDCDSDCLRYTVRQAGNGTILMIFS